MHTFHDIAAYLCRLGVMKGYSVIPEVWLPLEESRMEVDLIWATRLPDSEEPPNPVDGFLKCWQIVATFEIEGANVSKKRFEEHLRRIDHLANIDGTEPSRFIVLYTEHHSRVGWGPGVDRTAKLWSHLTSAADFADRVHVTDGPGLEDLLRDL